MNETIKNILNRRSVRSYKEDAISDENLELILKAGLYAPSAHNEQTWHFTVIRSAEKINSLSDKVKEAMSKVPMEWVSQLGSTPTFNVFYKAPVAILVSMEKKGLNPLADSSAAIQNMMIAAESLGIGSCWIGFPAFYFKEDGEYPEFGVPSTHTPRYVVTLGYAKGEKSEAPERRGGTVNYI